MSAPEFVPVSSFNRNAIISFLLSLLTLFVFCSGFLPLPFTILLCYPPGAVIGIISLFLGLKAQREIRTDNKGGRTLAVIGVWLSGLSIAAFVCLLTIGVAVAPRITEYVKQFFN